MKRLCGFTLIELVMVIALSGLVMLMISTVLSRPMEGFVGQSRRAILVDQAAGALNRMSRDVRLAIPNSLRISADHQAVELLLIHSAGRYLPNRVGGEGVSFSSAPAGTCGSSTIGARCDSVQILDANINPAGANWMVLYNVGTESGGSPTPGSNVWATNNNAGVITPTGTTFSVVNNTPAGESQIILGNLPAGGFRFAFASPQRRLYLAQTVVGYRCSGGQLLRYSYNTLTSSIPISPPSGSNPQPVAANVTSCNFSYQSGSTQRAGLLALNLQLSRDGESVQLMQQVHVDNAP